MSPRGWQDRIRDILDAIAEIRKFTSDMDYASFKADDKSMWADDEENPANIKM